MAMFDFLKDVGTYQDRKIDRFEKDKLIVDTAKVSDGKQPYETGISHPEYNGGSWVIVDMYPTVDLAKHGHNHWVEVMTAENLPDKLVDCGNAELAQLMIALGKPLEFIRKS